MDLASKWIGLPWFVACAVALACATPVGAPAPFDKFDIQGHRGARGLAPENTLAAFARAIELGVTTLELDVAVTRDGEVVVAHDAFVPASRCLGAGGAPLDAKSAPLFRDLTLAQVKLYDCGSLPPDPSRFPSPPWKASPGERIPTLGEVFELARRSASPELAFNIETKVDPGDESTLPAAVFVAAVVRVVGEHRMAGRTTLQSFDWRALVLAKKLEPRLRLAALVASDTLSPGWHAGIDGPPLSALRRLGARVDVVSPDAALILDATHPGHIGVDSAHRLGLRVIPWTVNDRETMKELIGLGVDGLITDYPDIGLEVARARGLVR